MDSQNWIDLAQDADTGIETLRAHFKGHAYDPHWHDSYLVGITEQGVQQFNCRRTKHQSTPGKVFLLEPGDIHDGDAPTEGGFTYRMLYLDPVWIERELGTLFEDAPLNSQLSFANTLITDPLLMRATQMAFQTLHGGELKIVRQTALDNLLGQLTPICTGARVTALTHACHWWRKGHATICMPMRIRTLAWSKSPPRPVLTAFA